MSKSLGNFITIRDLLEKWRPDAFRFLILSSHYRSQIEFSFEKMDEATQRLETIENVLDRVRSLISQHKNTPTQDGDSKTSKNFNKALTQARTLFFNAMDNDFNTPDAIAALFSLVSEAQKYTRAPSPSVVLLEKYLKFFTEISNILGLFSPAGKASDQLVDQLLTILVKVRQKARDQKNYDISDYIRDELASINIELQDYNEETVWRLVLPK